MTPEQAQRIQPGTIVATASVPGPLCWIGVSFLLLAYWLVAFHPHSWAYLDYVDGYYLYVAHRMAQGALLYSGLLGVQPPGIYLVGDGLFRLHDNLSIIRLFSAVLHSCIVLLVYGCGWRLYRSQAAAFLGSLLYSVAPFSLVWSRLFDPNPLVTCLSLGTLFLLLGGARSGAAGAGLLGGLALVTKIWYVPVLLVTIWYLAQRRRDLLPAYLAPLATVLVLVCVLGTLIVGSAFWQGLVVQDASTVSLSSFLVSLFRVVQYDWPLLLLAWAGGRMVSYPAADSRSFARWYLLASSSIIFATFKSGTLWPIYQFAEPSLALAGAGFLAQLLPTLSARVSRMAGIFGPVVLFPLTILLLIWWAAPALRDAGDSSDASVHVVVGQIERTSPSGSRLLAPPFYLFLSGRREFGELADVNIWSLRVGQGDIQARAVATQVFEALSKGRIAIVLADFRVRNLPGVTSALQAHYARQTFKDPLPPDRAVAVWAPRK